MKGIGLVADRAAVRLVVVVLLTTMLAGEVRFASAAQNDDGMRSVESGLDIAAMALRPPDVSDLTGLDYQLLLGAMYLEHDLDAYLDAVCDEIWFGGSNPYVETADQLGDAGWLRHYQLDMAVPDDSDPDRASHIITSSITEYADKRGAADGFDVMTNGEFFNACTQNEAIDDARSFGDRSELTRFDDPESGEVGLSVTIQVGSLIATVRLVHLAGDTPSVEEIEELADVLLTRIENVQDAEAPGLSTSALWLISDGELQVTPHVVARYARIDGVDAPLFGEDEAAFEARTENFADAIDVYQTRQTIGEGPELDLVVTLYRFPNDSSGSDWLSIAEDRLGENPNNSNLTPVDDVAAIGDESFAYTYDRKSGNNEIPTLVSYVRVDDFVAVLTAVRPALSQVSLDEVVAAQADCFADEGCAPLPLPSGLLSHDETVTTGQTEGEHAEIGILSETAYESPSFGYTISWDNRWEADPATSYAGEPETRGEADLLYLVSLDATLTFYGRPDTPVTFLAEAIAFRQEASENVELVVEGDHEGVPFATLEFDADATGFEGQRARETIAAYDSGDGIVVGAIMRSLADDHDAELRLIADTVLLDGQPVFAEMEDADTGDQDDEDSTVDPDESTPEDGDERGAALDTAGEWSEPAPLVSETEDIHTNPAVVTLADGRTLAVWNGNIDGFVWSERSDDGIWNAPRPVADGESAQAPALVALADGSVAALWKDADLNLLSSMLPAGSDAWTAPEEVASLDVEYASAGATAPRLAAAPDGTLYAAWEDAQRPVFAWRSLDGEWQTIPPTDDYGYDPAIAALPDGSAVAAWFDLDDDAGHYAIRFAIWDPATETWTDASDTGVEVDQQSRPERLTMTGTAAGAYLVFVDADGHLRSMSFPGAGSGWTDAAPVDQSDDRRTFEPHLAGRGDDVLLLTWRAFDPATQTDALSAAVLPAGGTTWGLLPPIEREEDDFLFRAGAFAADGAPLVLWSGEVRNRSVMLESVFIPDDPAAFAVDAPAEERTDGETSDEGDDERRSGTTYTSPTYGYAIAWDGDIWSVEDEASRRGEDSLELTSDTSLIRFTGTDMATDADECLDVAVDDLLDRRAYRDFEQAVTGDDDTPYEGEGPLGPYIGYTDGETAVYLECAELPAGDGVLLIHYEVALADFEGAFEPFEELLSAVELDPTDQDRGESDTENTDRTGTTAGYADSVLGWELSWNESWEQTADPAEDGILALNNGRSFVTIYPVVDYSGDSEDCVADQVTGLEEMDDVSRVRPLEVDGEPVAGGDGEAAYAAYRYRYAGSDGNVTLVDHFDCRQLNEDDSMLVIIQTVAVDSYEEESEALAALLEGIEIDN